MCFFIIQFLLFIFHHHQYHLFVLLSVVRFHFHVLLRPVSFLPVTTMMTESGVVAWIDRLIWRDDSTLSAADDISLLIVSVKVVKSDRKNQGDACSIRSTQTEDWRPSDKNHLESNWVQF